MGGLTGLDGLRYGGRDCVMRSGGRSRQRLLRLGLWAWRVTLLLLENGSQRRRRSGRCGRWRSRRSNRFWLWLCLRWGRGCYRGRRGSWCFWFGSNKREKWVKRFKKEKRDGYALHSDRAVTRQAQASKLHTHFLDA